MRLLTIGAFARAARLSPKALRLYDELGLLVPAHVDPFSGYRFYAPAQLDRARLVARLRRIGMPLLHIRRVVDLPPHAAAQEISAYWNHVEADLAARRALAACLIGQLSDKETKMTEPHLPITVRYAELSDAGLVRGVNQDRSYASSRMFAVADGFGAAGAPASAAAIDAVRALDAQSDTAPGDLLSVLFEAVDQASQMIGELVEAASRDDQASGTTLTAMLLADSQLALVHIGDSRCYLLRDGELRQLTQDHTMVQSMVAAGQLTPVEAAAHPQRSLLLKALDGRPASAADGQLHQAQAGDRYLLCSDGLSTVVPMEVLTSVIAGGDEPQRVVQDLVDMAHRAGAPDNVTCVVADVAPAAAA